MFARYLFIVSLWTLCTGYVYGQTRSDAGRAAADWRTAADIGPVASQSEAISATAASSTGASRTGSSHAAANIGGGIASLANDAGQVWKEYDISAYSARVTTTKQPQQAIIDWILRETGYEAWHSEPLGILTANSRALKVYHTPEMQAKIADIVDRFVNAEAAAYPFTLRVVTVDSPSWRTKAQSLLRPVPVQTPGVCAWVMAREDAAILLADLRRRTDYREHSSPYLMVTNGQTTVVPAMRSRTYLRDVISRPDLPAGYEFQQGQVDEGFSLDFSPLLTADRRLIDATIKCEIDQVEKMLPVFLEAAASTTPRNRVKIEVPQMTHYRFHERFRWPVDQVLLVGMGMVALPMPVDGKPLVPGVSLPIGNTPARADLLVFVESRGQTPLSRSNPPSPEREARTYRGRY
ncbi:MAG: hypothetical protein IT426_14770 [Pirellulales bacterium]|nr:hypothetical protein [Pirellulales bacterium]